MRNVRVGALCIVLLVALLLSGCGGQAAPVKQAVSPSPAPTLVPTVAPSSTPVPTATRAPTATKTPQPTLPPIPTKAPTATPPPAPTRSGKMPDAKADPMGALIYSASGDAFKTATFTYDMSMTMKPADEASAKAMGEGAAMLSALAIKGSGKGAMKVLDAAAGKTDMSMDLEMSVMGQKIVMQMVTVGDKAWVRMGGSGPWEETNTSAAAGRMSSGMDPNEMLKAFRNASQAAWVDDKSLDGQPMHHLRFKMDPSKFGLDSMVQGAMATNRQLTEAEWKAILGQMTLDGEVWLVARDLTLRQEKLAMVMVIPLKDSRMPEAKLLTTLDMTMRFDKVNEPVTIKPPQGN